MKKTTSLFFLLIFSQPVAADDATKAAQISEAEQMAVFLAQATPQLDYEQIREESLDRRGQFVGHVYRLQDYHLIQEIVQRSYEAIQNRAELSEELLAEVKVALKQKLIEMNLESEIRRSGQHFKIEIPLATAQLQELRKIYHGVQAEQKNKKPGPAKSSVEPSIFLEFAFVEIKKSALRKLGLRFGQPIGFDTVIEPKFIQTPAKLIQVMGFNPIGSFLDAALDRNLAKVHYKQSLVTANKRASSFKIGGQYTYRLGGKYVASTKTFQYGINMEFKPRLVGDQRVHLEFKANISEPDLSSGLGDFPEIRTKAIDTALYTRLDETIAIAGLLKATLGRSKQSLPGLGEIPVLGRLFSSKDYREHRSEAYLFITPKILKESWVPKFKEVVN